MRYEEAIEKLNKTAAEELSEKLLKFENNCGFTLIQTADEFSGLPKEARLVIHADPEQSRIYDRDDTSGNPNAQDIYTPRKVRSVRLNRLYSPCLR